ncbi:MAG TPA: sigma-54 dependent transcriptional regulator [Nitrospiria bacterium]|nr:sigma-54 dependent transcriptional regulator [Nitrospiria bacterium]
MAYKIVVADDEPDTRDICSKILTKEGYEVFTAKDGLETIKMLRETDFDLLLLDINMPNKSGLEVLDLSNAIGLDTVMITAYASVATAVEAIKKGAKDYIPKPFTASDIRSVVEKIISQQRLLKTGIHLKVKEGSPGFCGLVGESHSMQRIYEMIETIATTETNILIQGESGTGKELVARAIHQKSYRREGPFIPINCGAIPKDLLESELFGYIKGAFTGAVESREGLFMAAKKGTLLLDEVGETSHSFQVKLLRVLEDKEVRPIGGTETKKADIRIIAATNKELMKEVISGRFRGDLFYRLSVISLRLPPLRERKEDIPTLIHHFIDRFNQLYARQIEGLSPQAMNLLMEYYWPGNVRELENIIERAVIIEKGKIISPKVLDLRHRESGMQVTWAKGREGLIPSSLEMSHYMTLTELEKGHIRTVLRVTKGNRSKAARILGIGRRTLYDKIIEYGIKEEDEKD